LTLSAAALMVAIGALIVLALATRTDAPTMRPAGGEAGATPGIAGRARAQIRANRRRAGRLVDTSLRSELAALRGVPVVVNQWASWCPPCRAEFPFFRQMARRYRARVAFLGLDSRDGRGAAEAFLRRHPVGYPSVFDDDAGQARSIGAGTSWPTTVFLDAHGEAVFIRQGGYVDAAALDADIRTYALGRR
jgi:thiol-disulfide isomerase/thioredoxin